MSDRERLDYLGQQIRTARQRRRLPLRIVADHLGVSVPTAHAYEAGGAHIPALRLIELADLIGLDLGRLARRRALVRRAA